MNHKITNHSKFFLKNLWNSILLICISLFCLGPVILLLMYRAAGNYYQERFLQAFVTSNQPAVTTELLANPYQGFYQIHGYLLTPDVSADNLQNQLQEDYKHHTADPLTLIEINLRRYQNQDLDQSALEQVDQILSFWEEKQFQIILRPLYDWDGKSSETEPHTVEQIEAHMDQLAPIINGHKQAVFSMQGIFVGDFAEMHSTPYMENSTLIRLMKHLAEVTDPEIYLAVRTPAHRRIILDSMETDLGTDAHSGSLPARIGLFNDGMLGSGNDLGTYGDIPLQDSQSPSDKLVREDELSYQNVLCRFVPNGGEVTLDNPFNDIENAITDLRTMHVSYLNSEHHAEVLDKWKNSTVTTDDAWNHTDGYTYVQAHLGYRFSYEDLSSEAFDFWNDDTLQLAIQVHNSGFSNCYVPMTGTLTITDEAGQTVASYDLSDGDLRSLDSNTSLAFHCDLPVQEMMDNTYTIYYRITDQITEREILLANDLPHTVSGYELGSVTLTRVPTQKASPKEVFSHFLSYKFAK